MARSAQYSSLVEEFLAPRGQFLEIMHPKEPLLGHADQLVEIRQATDARLSGDRVVRTLFPAIRAGLLYYYDSLPETHALLRDLPGALVDYWRGMIHRREGDYFNAQEAYRRAGDLAFYSELQEEAAEVSSLFARQYTWDPYLFAGQCEQFKFGDLDLKDKLIAIQRLEFESVFQYTWQVSVEGGGV